MGWRPSGQSCRPPRSTRAVVPPIGRVETRWCSADATPRLNVDASQPVLLRLLTWSPFGLLIAAAMAGQTERGSRVGNRVGVTTASSRLQPHCQGESGAVEAGGQTHGQHAGMGSNHQGDQHFSLGQGHDRIVKFLAILTQLRRRASLCLWPVTARHPPEARARYGRPCVAARR